MAYQINGPKPSVRITVIPFENGNIILGCKNLCRTTIIRKFWNLSVFQKNLVAAVKTNNKPKVKTDAGTMANDNSARSTYRVLYYCYRCRSCSFYYVRKRVNNHRYRLFRPFRFRGIIYTSSVDDKINELDTGLSGTECVGHCTNSTRNVVDMAARNRRK